MSGAVEVAQAQVTLLAKFQKDSIRSAIASGMAGADGAADMAGQKSGQGFLGGLGRIVSVAAIGALTAKAFSGVKSIVSEGFAVGNEMTGYTKQLEIITGSATDAGKMLGELYDYAQGSVLDTKSVVAASKTLAGFGMSAEQATKVTKVLGNTSAVTGADMGSAAVVMGQVFAAGKMQAQDAMQFINQGIPIYDLLGKSLGKTTTELKDMQQAGGISAEMVSAALDKAYGDPELLARFSDTGTAALANLEDSMDSARLALMGVTLGATGFEASSGGLQNAVKDLTNGFATLVSSEGVQGFLGAVGDKIAGAVRIVTGLMQSLGDLLSGGQVSGGLAGIASTVGPLLAALNPLGALVREVIAPMLPQIGAALKPLLPALGDLAGNVGPALLSAISQIAAPLTQIATAVLPSLASALSGIARLLADQPGLVLAVIAAFVGFKAVTGTVGLVRTGITGVTGAVSRMRTGVAAARAGWATFAAGLHGVRYNALASSGGAVVNMLGRMVHGFQGVAVAVGSAVKQGALWVASQATALARGTANIAVLVAQKVALVATRAAQAVATAAQWLWNAALAANPIGLVVAALTALTAGLAWFFAQTEAGQQIWTTFVGFLAAAWDGLVAIFNAAVTAITQAWAGIAAFFTGLWASITGGAQIAWAGIAGFLAGLWTGIKGVATSVWTGIKTAIMTPVNAVKNFVLSAWSAISSGISGFANGIKTAVSTAFSAMVGIIKAPINGVISIVNGAIGALNRVSVTIPDWVPGVGGQRWGINIPLIPKIAEGATILPSVGGTLAILAEAGRAETVVDTGGVNRMIAQVNARLDADRAARDQTAGDTWNIYETVDPVATAMAIAARQSMLRV